MISYIHIKNIAIMEELEIEFKNSLNVLTGETGVGKSIIINAINFALGAKTSKDIIRVGADAAFCEVVFNISDKMVQKIKDEYQIEFDDNELIVSRMLKIDGKNTYRLNGMLSNSSLVREITSKLIDVHGQHEHQSLFDVRQHIVLLDKFAGEKVKLLKTTLKEDYDNYREINKKIESLHGNSNDRARLLDILNYEIDEIQNAKLQLGEEEDLLQRRSVMMSSDKIVKSLSNSVNELDSSLDGILKSIKEFEKIEQYNENFSKTKDMLKEAEVLVNESKNFASDYLDDFNFDEKEQEVIEERLELIDKLKRKYGNSIEEILNYLELKQKELDDIVNSESIIMALEKEKNQLVEQINDTCTKLSKERKTSANAISEKIERNLKDLEMKNAKFEIVITNKESFTDNGIDNVEFKFSSNLGESTKELSKIASGGEVSRVMLSIKNVLADADDIGTMIFDEIDTGISGMAAQKVAEKMINLSKNHQIICITHLPQIAAMADNNYKIVKEEKEGRTLSNITLLNEEDQIKEIARLVSGVKMTEFALAHAKEMKIEANDLKRRA